MVGRLRKYRKHLPTPKEVQEYRYIHIFGDALKQAELWTFNRASVSMGVGIGVYCAFAPMPFQMLAALFMATLMRGNAPLAISAVWISNPLTWVPIFTPCYMLGAWIMQLEPLQSLEQTNLLSLGWHYVAIWLGGLIIGAIAGVLSHFIINVIWRWNVQQQWAARALRRKKSKNLYRVDSGSSPE